MKYRTIVADPPWPYGGRSPRGHRDSDGKVKPGSAGFRVLPYPAMSIAEIQELPIASKCDPNGTRLFLWTTNKFLRSAFDVMEAWCFEYVLTLVWRKTKNPFPFNRSIAPIHAEYVLVGKCGKPGVTGRFPSSVLDFPAYPAMGHSAKPEGFIDLVEQVSPGPYLELFARRARFGWDYWGNESLETVELSA